MFLNTKTSSAYLVFQLKTDSFVGLVTGMIVTSLLGIIFESLYIFGSKLPTINRHESDVYNKRNVTIMLMQSALHILRIVIGYMLMLCVMTMNLWILASVLLGGGVGYFLFRPWSFNKKLKNGNGNIMLVRETTKPLLAKESFI